MISPTERKLTTILSADAVGYSRLMGADEAATLAVLKDYRAVMARHIEAYRGRIVNTAGDAVLAEFVSVVNGVECAITVQRDLAERNAALPEERRLEFRVGVNLGDVIVDGTDLYGEGVNIAARLQALAEPGGILISGTVYEHVRNKLALGFDFLGPQSVKNIADAVPAYRVVLQPGAVRAPAVPTLARAALPEKDDRLRQLGYLAARAVLFISLFFAINMIASPRSTWFQWPSLATALVFAFKALALYHPPER
jgi:adenylate cyclase